jgi:hypothetical protein
MNCPNCHVIVEAEASFCGNCGQQLRQPEHSSSLNQLQPAGHAATAPAYALTQPHEHVAETKALLSLLFGVIGIVGALFMAVLGIGFGIAGLVLGTISRSSTKRHLSTLGLFASSLAILAGLVVWVYAIRTLDEKKQQSLQTTSEATLASDLSTPCYSLSFVDKLNVSSRSDSCNLNAYNGQTLGTSTDAYKVFANQTAVTNVNDFTTIAKRAIEKDVADNMPGFVIDSQRVGAFAGSPAYIVQASNKAQNVAVVEAAVMRKVNNGENIFLLVHALNGDTADLKILESQWQWK